MVPACDACGRDSGGGGGPGSAHSQRVEVQERWHLERRERKPHESIQGRGPAIELIMGDGSTSGSQDVTFDVFEASWVDGFLVDHMQPQRTGSSQSQNSRLG